MTSWLKWSPGIGPALLAALLFGASTPLAKLVMGNIHPVLFAGLLYAGSGLGLGIFWLLQRLRTRQADAEASLKWRDFRWLAGAVLFGGVLGPVLLMFGLSSTPASSASLLLNLESVLTAVVAWVVFRENVDRRIFLGMVAIVAGGVLLSWSHGPVGLPWGALAIVGACACWAIDNNLTRAISGGDPVAIAGIKGGSAGLINIGVALLLGQHLPAAPALAGAAVIGLVGYGISLVAFVLALRHLGAARTGAYFSTAPFVGAGLSLLLLREAPGLYFWVAGALMALGVWLHVSESHEHGHVHEPLDHEHPHSHDDHHQHPHDFEWDGKEPHTHPHQHQAMKHTHPHYPDLHHRHGHGDRR
ncbi:MAG: DMT family transporter [Frankiaceae bacterium]|nr:DMT family transporter [Arenimonas sp.]